MERALFSVVFARTAVPPSRSCAHVCGLRSGPRPATMRAPRPPPALSLVRHPPSPSSYHRSSLVGPASPLSAPPPLFTPGVATMESHPPPLVDADDGVSGSGSSSSSRVGTGSGRSGRGGGGSGSISGVEGGGDGRSHERSASPSSTPPAAAPAPPPHPPSPPPPPAHAFECNICFDTPAEPVVTPCGHLYCWACLYRWLRLHAASPGCPVCKAAVSRETVIPIYGRGGGGGAATGEARGGEEAATPPRPRARRTGTFGGEGRGGAKRVLAVGGIGASTGLGVVGVDLVG